MYRFSQNSKIKLLTCEPKLQKLFNEVIKYVDCSILEGHRNEERQNKLYTEGKTKARFPHSNHNVLPSKAVDVVVYPVDWDDINRIHGFAGFVKGVASQMDIKIKWGGDFKNLFDSPHFELVK